MKYNNVIMVAEAAYSELYCDIAKILHFQNNLWVHLYCTNDQEIESYSRKNSDGRFSSISKVGAILSSLKKNKCVELQEVKRAQHYEEKYGHLYSALAVGNRHLGRGYALGAPYHPRSRYSETSSYCELLRAYSDVYESWEAEFTDKSPCLVIGGNKQLRLVASKNGVDFRNLIVSRFGSRYYWGEDEFGSHSMIKSYFKRLKKKNLKKVNIDTPYLLAASDSKNFMVRKSLVRLVLVCGKMAAKYLYWNLRGYSKAKGYYFWSNVEFLVRQCFAVRRHVTDNEMKLRDLEGKKFVFLPLATEPETTLSVLSPEYFFQHESIVSIARDLPAGVLLVVKESIYALGRRHSAFYRQIKDLKNVVLLHPEERALDIMKNSLAVACISGTAGYEATAMGIPVISFGRHNLFSFMDHVFVIRDNTELRGVLTRVCSGQINAEKSWKDGARFYDAIMEISFEMPSFNIVDRKSYNQEGLQNCYNALIKSMPGLRTL